MATISENIQRIQNAVADLKTALNENGVECSSEDRINEVVPKVRAIWVPAGPPEHSAEPNPDYSIPAETGGVPAGDNGVPAGN